MKYHGHIIQKVFMDLGEEKPNDNKAYEIYKDGQFVEIAWTLNNAKEFIDSNYDRRYLC